MRKSILIAFATSLCAAAFAAPTITVTPTLAPNVFGSPSYPSWVGNSYQAQLQGLTTFGTPGTPDYYQAQAVVDRHEAIVTGYNSWKGVANPGAPFGSELGNRMLFGLHIKGNGQKFSIDNLSFNATSTGDGGGLDFGFGFGSYNYSNDYVGIQYGGDGVLGGGDDTLITAGANSQLVDELIGRGSGNSYASYVTDPGATLQDKLNGVAEDPSTQWTSFTGVYTLRGITSGDVTGAGTFAAVPEPGSMAALGLGALALLRKRRKK